MLELCCGAGQIGLLAVLGIRPHAWSASTPTRWPAPTPRTTPRRPASASWSRCGWPGSTRRCDPDERFPVIVADPPWVRRQETGRFPEDPLLAIDGGYDGLDVARLCLEVIAGHLLPGGSALLQVGTVAQAEVLRGELPAYDAGLAVSEVRELAGGVLVRLDRP